LVLKKIIENAKSKVKELANETEVYKLAEQKSEEVIKKAKLQAQEITEGAFNYADEVMGEFQAQLSIT